MRGRRIQVGAISVTLYARHKKNFHHDQRPRFDDGGTKWNAPTDSAHLKFIRLAKRLNHSGAAAIPHPSDQGFHSNRPPPIR